MVKKILSVILFSFLVSGCSTKFVYDHPPACNDVKDYQAIAALASVQDERTQRVIDRIYEENPIQDIDIIFKEELMSTGLFTHVIPFENRDSTKDIEADIIVFPNLLHMDWEVPNYDQICTTAFVLGLFTGIVGGTIYGCTDTDVYGDTTLHIKTIDSKTGEILIDQEYAGHCESEKLKFTCDSLDTKATSVGDSLEAAIDKFKADLIETLSEQKTESVLLLNAPNSNNLQGGHRE